MSAAPIASGARAALPMTAQPTVKTRPNVPMNSVTYLRICHPLLQGAAVADSPARVGEIRCPPTAWQAMAEVAGSRCIPVTASAVADLVCPARVSLQALIAETGPVSERLRVREIDDDEGQRLVRIIRRGSGSVVTW